MANAWDSWIPQQYRTAQGGWRPKGVSDSAQENVSQEERYNTSRGFHSKWLTQVESGNLPEGWTPKSNNIPTMDQWWAAGNRPVGDNSPEYQYLHKYYNIPSKEQDFFGKYAVPAFMALMGGAAASGVGGGGAAAAPVAEGAVAELSGFVDPWEVMGDPSAYGLGGGEAAAGGAAAAGAETVAATPGAASQGATVAEVASPYNAGAGAFDAAGVGITNAEKVAAGAYAPESNGLIGSILKWGHDNPVLASTAVSVGGGLLKGAFAPTPEEQANAVADAQIKRDQAQLQNRQNANNLGNVNLNRLKPTGVRIPRPGLIQSRM